jgi:spoIIIJ-associated protein
MNEQRTTYESTAPSIEEAIEKGLAELGLTADNVDIEILDEGTKGLFGLGSRQARVRLTSKEVSEPASEEVAAEPEVVAEPEEIPQPVAETVQTVPPEEPETAEADHVLQIAHDTVAELLEKMKVSAEVTAAYIEDDDYHGQKPIWVDIHGDDLSILIGRKAETLNALQYITSLIIGKELGRSVPLTVDVEGYRSRRKQQLSQLANRVAEQVIKTGRSQALEPMPASERRLIHIELRDHPQVYTESTGEGERRKIVIYLKD